ncbi:MAG: Kelch repeat-containing protein [Nitrospinota bacterium]
MDVRKVGIAFALAGWLALIGLGTPQPGEAQGRWLAKRPSPTERGEVAVAAVGEKVYVIGGFGGGTRRSLVEEYDTRTDTWRARAPLPIAVRHPAAAGIGGKLYVVGGFLHSAWRWPPVGRLFEYDPTADRWRERAPMPTARGALAAVAIEGKLYAVGGVAEGGDTGALELYDPKTDTWRRLAPMPTPRDHLAAGAVGGRLYVIGGRLGSYARNLDANEAYDPKTNRWAKLPPLPTPRSGIAGAAVGGKIYVFGGESTEGTFDENEAFDPGAGRWLKLPPMPTARHGLGAAVAGGQIYVMSGGRTPGGSSSGLNEVYEP